MPEISNREVQEIHDRLTIDEATCLWVMHDAMCKTTDRRIDVPKPIHPAYYVTLLGLARKGVITFNGTTVFDEAIETTEILADQIESNLRLREYAHTTGDDDEYRHGYPEREVLRRIRIRYPLLETQIYNVYCDQLMERHLRGVTVDLDGVDEVLLARCAESLAPAAPESPVIDEDLPF